MKTFQRISLVLLMVMTFFLPFWLTFGRNAFGSHGWLTVPYLFFIAPILFITLLVFNALLWARRDVRRITELSKVDSWLLLVLYTFVFLHGFFIVDGGDTPESLDSVMTILFNNNLHDLSALLSAVTYTISCLLLIACLVTFIYELTKKRSNSG